MSKEGIVEKEKELLKLLHETPEAIQENFSSNWELSKDIEQRVIHILAARCAGISTSDMFEITDISHYPADYDFVHVTKRIDHPFTIIMFTFIIYEDLPVDDWEALEFADAKEQMELTIDLPTSEWQEKLVMLLTSEKN